MKKDKSGPAVAEGDEAGTGEEDFEKVSSTDDEESETS